jgi:very-short-patch-repair endonuclease
MPWITTNAGEDIPFAFVLQHPIKNEAGRIVSRADFAFVAEKIAIFCDGARYHLRQHQWQRDLRQRRELVRLGWRCLVFTGAEIMADGGRMCVEEIIVAVKTSR